jgi:ABC-type dipeptide/oligopeptide/nickel transport system permease component
MAAAYGSPTRDRGVRVFAYVLLGVPTMVLGSMVAFELMTHYDWVSHPIWCAFEGPQRVCTPPFMALYGSPLLEPVHWGPDGVYGWPNTVPWEHVSLRYLLPASVLSVGLATGLFRQARRAIIEHRSSAVSKMLAAKGAGQVTDARHAVRNAALPLVSVSFAELLSVLTIWSFVVEALFHVPGIFAFVQIAVRTRDMPLLVGTTTVLALLTIGLCFVEDLLAGVLDPEVGTG